MEYQKTLSILSGRVVGSGVRCGPLSEHYRYQQNWFVLTAYCTLVGFMCKELMYVKCCIYFRGVNETTVSYRLQMHNKESLSLFLVGVLYVPVPHTHSMGSFDFSRHNNV